MPTNTTAFSIGDDIRLQVIVTNTTGAVVDTGVTLIVNSPSTRIVYGPVTSTDSTVLDNSTIGTWHKIINPNRAGRWTYQWKSTGTVNVTTGGAFAVRPDLASS